MRWTPDQPRQGAAAIVCAIVCLAAPAAAQVPFEEVVGNLSHVDPTVRIAALRLLREAAYPEAAVPVAALLADAIDRVQLEAIDTEISLFLAEDVPARRRIAGVVEVRNPSQARAAFADGPRTTIPVRVPVDVLNGLVKILRDDTPLVRYEATYALGILAPTGLGGGTDPAVIRSMLDTLVYGLKDPESLLRTASADVLARLYSACELCGPAEQEALAQAKRTIGDNLIAGMNDRVGEARAAAARALGALVDDQAIQALTDQVKFYRRGESMWAPLDGLAQIAHPSSVPLFQELVKHRDDTVRRYAFEGLARTRDQSLGKVLEDAVSVERSESAALALAYAFHRLGRGSRLNMLINALRKPALRAQARAYLLEIGGEAMPVLLSYLKDVDQALLVGIADLVGRTRDQRAVMPLEALLVQKDPRIVSAVEVALLRLGRPAVSRTP
jgi:HEAT repeat protein